MNLKIFRCPDCKRVIIRGPTVLAVECPDCDISLYDLFELHEPTSNKDRQTMLSIIGESMRLSHKGESLRFTEVEKLSIEDDELLEFLRKRGKKM